MTIDGTFRIGRCNHCSSRPAFAWPASSGMRVDDMRCPRCKSPMDKTSREARNMRVMTADEVSAQRDAAIERMIARVTEHEEVRDAWIAEGGVRGEFHADSYQRSIEAREADIARMVKAAAKAQAV